MQKPFTTKGCSFRSAYIQVLQKIPPEIRVKTRLRGRSIRDFYLFFINFFLPEVVIIFFRNLTGGSLETFLYLMKKTAGRKNLSFTMICQYIGGYVFGKKWWLISRLPRGTVISRDKTSIAEFVSFDYIQWNSNPTNQKNFHFF